MFQNVFTLGLRIEQLSVKYLEHCESHYKESNEASNCELGLRKLRKMFGRLPAKSFGPKKLKEVRAEMVREGKLTRRGINKRINHIKRMFRWAVSEEAVSATVIHALESVRALERGRTTAPEHIEIPPVDDEHIEAVLHHVTPVLAAMIRIQRLTGMRPGEVCNMQSQYIDASEEIWVYRPAVHKTRYRGKKKVVYIGAAAQEVLASFLDRRPDDFLFSPMESMQMVRDRRRRERKTPLSCGNRAGTNRKTSPEKAPGRKYTTETYRGAIHAACSKAGIPQWSPNQIRKTAGTEARKKYGLETAQALLGHSCASTTERYYAKPESELARQIAGDQDFGSLSIFRP